MHCLAKKKIAEGEGEKGRKKERKKDIERNMDR